MGGCKVGDTIKFENFSGGYEHLWIVITPPHGDPPQVIIVNVTSLKANSDRTIILDVGDHPFIKHPTVIYYTDAKIVRVSEVEKIQQELRNSGNAPINARLLSKIQAGIESSQYVKPMIKNFFLRAMKR